MKLRAKLTLTILLLSLVLFLSNSLVVLGNVRSEMQQDKYLVYGEMTQQALQDFERVSDSLEYSFFDFCKTEGIGNILTSSKNTAQKTVQLRWKLDSLISISNRALIRAFIVDLDGKLYESSREGAPPEEDLEEFLNFVTRQDVLWFRFRDEVYLSRAIYTLAPYVRRGYMIGLVDQDFLTDSTGMGMLPDGVWAVFSGDDQLLFSSDGPVPAQTLRERAQEAAREGNWIGEEKTGQWLSCCRVSNRDGWKVLLTIPYRQMMDRYYHIAGYTFAVSFLLTLAALAVTLGISLGMTKRISDLIASIKRIHDGNTNEQIIVRGRDEVAELANRFNELMTYQTGMMEAKYELLELKYRFIQAQISPHFMSNILSSITSYSVMGKEELMDELCVKTSHYLKTNLRLGDARFVTLEEETDSLREYVDIFRLTHQQPVEFVCEYAPGVGKEKILSMLLQPLVENAVIHATSCDEERQYLVRVRARKEADRVIVEVEDNGCGMSAETLDRIEKIRSDPGARIEGGFGIGAVIRRMRLQYGDQWVFSVHTQEGKGTRITLGYPAEEDN